MFDDFGTYHLTDRVSRIFSIAETLSSSEERIVPIHLLIGACLEGTGVSNEIVIYLFNELGNNFLEDLKCKSVGNKCTSNFKIDKFLVSDSTIKIMELAMVKMKRFNQVYINEGLLISSILEVDDYVISLLGSKICRDILKFVGVTRDLTVNLSSYIMPQISTKLFYVRKAKIEDYCLLTSFVEIEFGQRWLDSVNNGFANTNSIPIYIAFADDKIVGFACYDVVRGKKGLFGPMGTSKFFRTNGVGAALLHHCLNDMKLLNYGYVIIDQAGPIEFYEKCCNAKLIPL